MSNIDQELELPPSTYTYIAISHDNKTNTCLGLPPPAPFLRKTRSSQKLSTLPNQVYNELEENSGNYENFEDPYDGILEALMNMSCSQPTVDNGIIGEYLSSQNISTDLNK